MAKLKRADRIYVSEQLTDHGAIPAWRIVKFWRLVYGERYLVATFVYPTLEQANNGRILARAFAEFSRIANIEGTKQTWANFARHLNYIHHPKHGRERTSLGDAVSAKIYGHCSRGTLPKDQRVRQMIYDLSGWPWE